MIFLHSPEKEQVLASMCQYAHAKHQAHRDRQVPHDSQLSKLTVLLRATSSVIPPARLPAAQELPHKVTYAPGSHLSWLTHRAVVTSHENT